MKKKATSSQLCKGPSIQGYTVLYNDEQRIIIVDGQVVALTPTEYNLCRVLFEHAEQLERGEHKDLFVSFTELEARCGLPRYLVLRHLQNANLKFQASTPLALACDGNFGYILLAHTPLWAKRRLYPLQKNYAFAV